jgi:Zn ribbon nucleic-acid-binding protein
MTQIIEMPMRTCLGCGVLFRPKPGGWNAKYHNDNCKIRAYAAVRKRPSRAGQETYYSRVVKADPIKLAAHMARSAASQKKIRQWLADYKMTHGCVDCGYSAHSAALQIDHNGKKVADISLLRSSIKRMEAEIQAGKCVVRCANCHAIKTWAEKNGLPNPSGHSEYQRGVAIFEQLSEVNDVD